MARACLYSAGAPQWLVAALVLLRLCRTIGIRLRAFVAPALRFDLLGLRDELRGLVLALRLRRHGGFGVAERFPLLASRVVLPCARADDAAIRSGAAALAAHRRTF